MSTGLPKLYPLKFTPILLDKIWGGDRLRHVLNKPCGDQCGESWEISGLEAHPSVVAEGPLKGKTLPELIRKYEGQLVGKEVFASHGHTFPLLIKFLDAADDLSIQVHPSDMQKPGEGKTEMWYVLQAEPGAALLSGFRRDVPLDEIRQAVAGATLDQLMNREAVKPGDTFLIRANHVHTIGKGILLAEIQQSSDITYRLYDFDRRDAQGNRRELHLEEALGVLDNRAGSGRVVEGQGGPLVSCAHFSAEKHILSEKRTFEAGTDSFHIFINVSGNASGKSGGYRFHLRFGETLLLPAGLSMELEPSGQVTLLETYLGNNHKK
jgi:mannose-6-phosphate isomerase